MSDVIDKPAEPTLDGKATSRNQDLQKLQEEMSTLVKQLSTVEEMTPSERQRLQVNFELKSLEIKRRILLAEQEELAAQLPVARDEIESANTAVKTAQERYRDALNLYNQIEDRRKRTAQEAEQILRECEAVRLKLP